MGKHDLIGGSLWEFYSQQVVDRMNQPKYRGELTESDAQKQGGKLIVADWGAESCGDTVRLYWIVDEKTGRILDARFKSFGCGTAIASSDAMAEMCIGKTVDEAVKITNLDVEFLLRDEPTKPAVPPQKMHCSVMAYDVIKKAASIYSGKSMSDYDDEEMVCECARITLSTIKEVIKLNNLKTVEEITEYTKAGAFCKSCIRPGGHEKRKYYLEEILKETRREMEREQESVEKPTFESLTLVQKLRQVEMVLDEVVRPILARDGGGLELEDVKEEDGFLNLYIGYRGACRHCASGQAGTMIMIQQKLRDYLSEKINVYSC